MNREELTEKIKELANKGDLKAAYALCDLYEKRYPHTLDGPRHWIMLHRNFEYLRGDDKQIRRSHDYPE